jgi:dynein heavy chain
MLARLFKHESHHVYVDRLVTEDEVETVNGIFNKIVKSGFVGPSISAEDLIKPSDVFTNFMTTSDGSYVPIPSMEKLKSVLDAKLVEYNNNNAIMDLVLFKQVILHIARINRIIKNPGGNEMLVGVGSSGKQSLCWLAALMSEFEVRQISVTSNYGVEDLRGQHQSIYLAAGVHSKPTAFLMTESQISNEKLLVYINGMITSGWIPDLFPEEDLENILGSIASKAKSVGILDNPEARTSFFVLKVKKNLHVVLAFSPVGVHSEFKLSNSQALLTILSLISSILYQGMPWLTLQNNSFKMWT